MKKPLSHADIDLIFELSSSDSSRECFISDLDARLFKIPNLFLVFICMLTCSSFSTRAYAIDQSLAQISVEWFQPETTKSDVAGRATIHIAGKTQPASVIEIDLRKVTFVRAAGTNNPKLIQQKFLNEITPGNEIMRTLSNSDAYFELSIDFPQGLIQIPIQVVDRNKLEKTFLITFDVSVKKAKMDAQISKNIPPAAAKNLRVWFGLGLTYQKYSQTVGGVSNVSFSNFDSPSLLGRLGYFF